MSDETRDLKPCPFCGGEATLQEHKNPACPDWWVVVCWGCEAKTLGQESRDEAVDAWNKRAQHSGPLRHPHGILVTRNCNLADSAMDHMGEYLKLVDADERPSVLYLDATPAYGCEPTDAEIVYYSLTAGRSIALGRDPVLEAIERGELKMRVERDPSEPLKCTWCDGEIDGSDVIHADPGDGECTAFCSMPCVEKARVYLATLPKRESSVTMEESTDDGND